MLVADRWLVVGCDWDLGSGSWALDFAGLGSGVWVLVYTTQIGRTAAFVSISFSISIYTLHATVIGTVTATMKSQTGKGKRIWLRFCIIIVTGYCTRCFKCTCDFHPSIIHRPWPDCLRLRRINPIPSTYPQPTQSSPAASPSACPSPSPPGQSPPNPAS